jgi:hypothetical protein
MAKIEPTSLSTVQALKTPIKCFLDDTDMEFIMPENQGKEMLSFLCPKCYIVYEIPIQLVRDKRIIITANL